MVFVLEGVGLEKTKNGRQILQILAFLLFRNPSHLPTPTFSTYHSLTPVPLPLWLICVSLASYVS